MIVLYVEALIFLYHASSDSTASGKWPAYLNNVLRLITVTKQLSHIATRHARTIFSVYELNRAVNEFPTGGKSYYWDRLYEGNADFTGS